MTNTIQTHWKQKFNKDFAVWVFMHFAIFLNLNVGYGQYPDALPPATSQESIKADNAFHTVLDSIHEIKSFGYYTEFYRWYYHYNQHQLLDTLWRYFYNANGIFEQITEIRTYNADGQIIRMVKRQPDYTYLNDSDYIKESYSVDYFYEDGKLVQKNTFSIDALDYQLKNEYYFFDAEGRLMRDSLVGDQYHRHVTDYFYNTDGELEYVMSSNIYSDRDPIYGVYKYVYEKTDTIKLTKRYGNNTLYKEKPIPDTITHWTVTEKFYETYDPEGRRKSVMLIVSSIDNPEWLDYKAEFTWTESGQLLHASYFTWEADGDTGKWVEATRIDNRYDTFGNLLQYDKTFYDARTGKWETEHSKTYYYTYVESGLADRMVKTGSLSIFPNPTTDEIRVIGISGKSLRYTVYNLYGQPVISGRLEDQFIDVSHLKPGFYILEIHKDHSRYSGRFVKY